MNNPFLYHLVIPALGGAHLGEAYFYIRISQNPEFFNLDYRDPVKITWLDTNQLAFNGFSHEVYANEDSVLFLCAGGPRRLFQGKIVFEFIDVPPLDAMYFVGKSANMPTIFEGGVQPLLIQRNFKVIFPILGLILHLSSR